MIDRFYGEAGRRLLIEALQRQELILGDVDVALALVDFGKLMSVGPRVSLISQDDTDNSIFFIVSGRFSIQVNGRQIAERFSGQTVGEMSIIDPVAKRSAAVISKEESVVVAVTECDFSVVASKYPNVWRRLAVVMASRLRERNRFVGNVNDKIRVFIGSSSESVPIANEIQCGLSQAGILAKVWTNSVFSPSVYFLEALEETSRDVDFAVLVMGPDDRVESRGVEQDAPRDNVIFELGLFIGSLGRKRVFLVSPRGIDIKIPSDLLGITLLTYCDLQRADLVANLGPVCTQLRRTMESLGVR